ncbi:MAG: cysteine hydrolase family protein [Anaerolineae bacterium]
MRAFELTTLEEQIAQDRCALLVIDMQNDFVSPQGMMARFGFDLSMVQEVAPRLARFIQQARQRGIFIVHTRVINDATQNPPSWYAFWGPPAVTIEGSWGAAFAPGFEPQEGEPVVTKYTYGAFTGTNLDTILRRREVKTLIVTGTGPNICAGDTMHQGFALGYHIVAPRDLLASFTVKGPEFNQTVKDVAMYILERHYGKVVTSEEIVQIWDARAGARSAK